MQKLKYTFSFLLLFIEQLESKIHKPLQLICDPDNIFADSQVIYNRKPLINVEMRSINIFSKSGHK